jgi:hypothetical protein
MHANFNLEDIMPPFFEPAHPNAVPPLNVSRNMEGARNENMVVQHYNQHSVWLTTVTNDAIYAPLHKLINVYALDAQTFWGLSDTLHSSKLHMRADDILEIDLEYFMRLMCENNIRTMGTVIFGAEVPGLIVKNTPRDIVNMAAGIVLAAKAPALLGRGANKAPPPATAQRVQSTAAPAVSTRIDPNKINHVFNKVGRGLEPLVQRFGSKANAYNEVQRAAQKVVDTHNLTGQFSSRVNPIVVEVGGMKLDVGGAVIDGVLHIGTFALK